MNNLVNIKNTVIRSIAPEFYLSVLSAMASDPAMSMNTHGTAITSKNIRLPDVVNVDVKFGGRYVSIYIDFIPTDKCNNVEDFRKYLTVLCGELVSCIQLFLKLYSCEFTLERAFEVLHEVAKTDPRYAILISWFPETMFISMPPREYTMPNNFMMMMDITADATNPYRSVLTIEH